MSLELNWQLMLLVFVTFVLLILILNAWLYRPMLEFIQKRDALLGEDARGLEEQKEEVARLRLEADEVLRHARSEAKKIKDCATLEAQEIYEEKIGRLKIEIESRFLNARRELSQKRAEIHQELQERSYVFEERVRDKFLALGGCQQ